jgi:hypothetical protein
MLLYGKAFTVLLDAGFKGFVRGYGFALACSAGSFVAEAAFSGSMKVI